MIKHCTVWSSFLKDHDEIEYIECCQANTTKIIDTILKNATLKREFSNAPRNSDNWLFDIQYSTRHSSIRHTCIFRFDGRIKKVWAI